VGGTRGGRDSDGKGTVSVGVGHRRAERTVDELADRLFEELERRADEVAVRSRDAIVGGVPAYAPIRDPAFAESIYRHSTEHVLTVARVMREQRMPTDEELDFVRRQAVRRVGTVPLEMLLHSYRIGHRVMWEWLLAEAGDEPGAAEMVRTLVSRTIEYTDVISVAATEAYIREQQRRDTDRDRARRDLLDDLLAGRFLDGGDARVRATALGLEVSGEFVVAVAVPADGQPSPPRLLHLVAEAVGEHGTVQNQAAFVVVRHDEVVALVPLHNRTLHGVRVQLSAALADLPGPASSMVAGISAPCSGLADFPRGYEEAHHALRLSRADTPVVILGDVSLLDYLVAHADATAARVVAPRVQRLLDDDQRHDGVLVDTLAAYVDADLNVVRAAQRLGVHPNTVHYRLGRIGQLAGINPRRVADLVDVLTSVRVLRQAAQRATAPLHAGST
jgi:sugar diacid utilization regulator